MEGQPQPIPGALLFQQQVCSFAEGSSVYAAIDLGIFDAIDEVALTAKEIKAKCSLNCEVRNLLDFLDILYLKGHLEREGLLEEAKYKTRYNLFVSSNPYNIIAVIRWMYKIFGTLMRINEALKNGSIQKEDPFVDLYDDSRMIAFLKTMAVIQKQNFALVGEKIDFSQYSTVTDIGGCLGEFSFTLKRMHPHLQCISYDLPVIEKDYRDYEAASNMQGQVTFQAGDMFKEDFPKSDVIAMGNILHDWNDEKKHILFQKAFDAINPGGVFVIVEELIDDERKVNQPALYMSLFMMVETYKGFNMSLSDIKKYAEKYGFSRVESFNDKFAVCFK
jgi:SAM-dependent methyltransferase